MDRANWVLLGLAGVCFFVGLRSRQDEADFLFQRPVSLVVESSPVRRIASIAAAPTSIPSSAVVASEIKSSYRMRMITWLRKSEHKHAEQIGSRSVSSENIGKKFKLRDSYFEFKVTNHHNRPLIFENRVSYLRFHFCDHSGVALQNLFNTGTAGTFYFQEGHVVALRSIKKEPFCSITIRRKDNIQEKLKVSYSVIEKKADFRQLPNFTGVRFWYGNNSPGEIVQEISCYTPVINPKQTEYDSLTGQDLAYAFHMNLAY